MTMRMMGTDLGNSRTKVAIPDVSGNPAMLPIDMGEMNLSSVIYFDVKRIIVGREAVNAGLIDPSRCVANWKRHMGTDTVLYTGEDGAEYRARDIARIILAEVAKSYEAQNGHPVPDVAISVPANYTDRQKHETKEAAEALGLNVLTLPHEPTAAILGNRLDRGGDGLVLVVDLGGGTFDCSIAEISGNSISVITTDGEPDLGGQDFDAELADLLIDRFQEKFGCRPEPSEHPIEFQDLSQRIEQLKITLSKREQAPIYLSFGGQVLNLTVTRAEFEAKTHALIERATTCVMRTLRDGEIDPTDLHEILLAGGASQMPAFSEAIEKELGRKPSAHTEPHYAAAKGNVIAARMEIERQGKSLYDGDRRIPQLNFHARDVTGRPIGVKVVADEGRLINSVILGKGVPIPSDRTEPFLLAERGQTDALIELLQGADGAAPEECQPLGHLELTGMESTEDNHRIEIRLKIDRNGMLSANAYDPLSGQSADLTIDYTKSERATPQRKGCAS